MTATTTRDDTTNLAETVAVIKQTITPGVLMSLGAHSFASTRMDGGAPALYFRARILPFKTDGTRSEAVRIMHVLVWLTARDDYAIRVGYTSRGKSIVHYETEGLYADRLQHIMLALDYDGPEALNPRFL